MKRFGKLLSLVLAVVMIVSVFAACSGNGDDNSSSSSSSASTSGSSSASGSSSTSGDVTITKNKLVLIAPMTGANTQYGTAYSNSCTMAVDNFNKAGGVNGVEIVLEVNDDKGDQKEAINLATKAVADESVFCIIGSFGSSVSMAMAPVIDEAKMPFISPNTSHPDFPGMSEYIVSISATQLVEQKGNSTGIYDDGHRKLAIIYQNTDNGLTSCEQLEEQFTALGGEIVAKETYAAAGQTKDFTPILSNIKAANPDAIFLSSDYADAAQIILQMPNVGINLDEVAVWTQGQCMKTEFLDVVKDKAFGVIASGSTVALMDNLIPEMTEVQQAYVTEYNERFGEGKCDAFAAAGYDAAIMALDAIKNVGDTDPMAFVTWCRELHCADQSVQHGEGAYFDEERNMQKPTFKYQIGEDNLFHTYTAGQNA